MTGIIVEEVASFLDIHPGIIISVDNGIILNKIWGIIAEIVAGKFVDIIVVIIAFLFVYKFWP